jgi:hypothetical protein
VTTQDDTPSGTIHARNGKARHADAAALLAFSADGKHPAAALLGGTVRLQDTPPL